MILNDISEPKKKKVAIYGGSFNPLTLGHIFSAQEIQSLLKDIEEIWFMPCSSKHYKPNGVYMDEFPSNRVDLLRLGLADYPRFKVFTYELDHPHCQFTYQVIKTLLDDVRYKDFEFSYIIGGDQARDFTKWYQFQELEKLIQFIIIPRAGADCSDSFLRKNPHIYLIGAKTSNISSTMVREKLASGIKVDYLVPDTLNDYFKRNNPYLKPVITQPIPMQPRTPTRLGFHANLPPMC